MNMTGTPGRRKATGIGLIVLGILFLFVANDIILGWGDVWPLFFVFGGLLLLKIYAASRSPEMLFGGITAFFLGVFLFLFSVGALAWERMNSLWPFIPLISAFGLLAVSATQRRGTASLISGVGLLLFAVLGFLYNTGFLDEHVAAPLVRFWPLVLIVAGIVLLRTHKTKEDPEMEAVRQVMGEGPPPTSPGAGPPEKSDPE